jgi:ligand-binding sensor domain-containing protein/nitrate/nitrite-specific signal transduction histidine kinase
MRRTFLFALICVLANLGLVASSASASMSGVVSPRISIALSSPDLPPPLPPSVSLRFERLSDEQGLSMSVVNSIAQDHQGFMWFATQDGLNRYDGYRFHIFKHDPENPDSLSTSWVDKVFVDSAGTVWAGTFSGLDRYDPLTGKFIHLRHDPNDPASLSQNHVNRIYEDRSGVLWVSTERGLDFLPAPTADNPHPTRFSHLSDNPDAPQVLREGMVKDISQDRSGVIWIATDRGLVAYDAATGKFTFYQHDENDPRSLSYDNTAAVLEDRYGNLWVATCLEGLDRMGPERSGFDHFSPDPETPGSLVYGDLSALLEDSKGYLWVGTWGAGLQRLDPLDGRFVHYANDLNDPHSLSGDIIASLYEDTSGVLWVGTYGASLSKFDLLTGQFVNYRQKSGSSNSLSSNIIWAVLGETDTIWIGTQSGLDRLDRQTGKVSHYRHDDQNPRSLYANNVLSLYKDRQGNYWVGTSGGGLGQYIPATDDFNNYVRPSDNDTTQGKAIRLISEDEQGYLWVGTSQGLGRFDPRGGEFTNYYSEPDNPDSLSSSYILSINVRPDGMIWVGTDEGLNLFDPKTGQASRYTGIEGDPNSLSSPAILSILPDQDGTLWLGTTGGGLNHFDPATGSFRSFREKDGLPNDTIYGILQDDNGYLWMSTNKGLARFDPRTAEFTNYFAPDGLQANEFNQGAYHRSTDGELFFGGVGGLTVFNPQDIHDNLYVPPVALVSLTYNGKPVQEPLVKASGKTQAGSIVSVPQSITLKYPENSFEFEAAALSFIQSDKNQYAYTLEGFDKDWIYPQNTRVGRYTNLSGGEYTLRVKASNNDGLWNEQGIAINIMVVPPFWQTWWFRGVLLVLFGLAVFTGYRLRVRSVLAHSHKLEQQVEERTHEIERRRQELEALYRADEDLYSNLHLDPVLQSLVDSAVRLLRADKGSLLVWDERHEKLVARASRGFAAETLKHLSLSAGEGVAGTVAISGKPTTVEDTWTDERVSRRITDVEGIRAFIQVPIWVGGEVFGVFSADYTQPRRFNESDLRLLNSLAQRAALAVQNAQIYEQTQEQAIVDERSRLARELHDAVTQTLFSASLIAEALPTVWENNPQDARGLLGELRQLSRGALAEMRTLLMELRPAALSESNLDDLLRQLGDAATGREGIPVSVVTNGRINLPPDVHIAFYRIAQEALNNVVKHARATQAYVRLSNLNQAISNGDNAVHRNGAILTVSDNGRGFDPDQVTPNHLGLGIMRERSQAIGATLTLESQPGSGTQITILWEGNHEQVEGQSEKDSKSEKESL